MSGFKMIKEISYPHASNEVMEVTANLDGEEGEYIVEV